MIKAISSIAEWAGGGFWAWVLAISIFGAVASGSAAVILGAFSSIRKRRGK